MVGRFDVPPAVTVARGDQRIRCTVVEWDDDTVRCEPDRVAPEEAAFLIPQSVVEVSWADDTALISVDGKVEGRPERGVFTISVSGPQRQVQRRDRIRARCSYKCELAVVEDGKVRRVRAETIDLSGTGVGVRAVMSVEVGASVAVAIYPPTDELPLLATQVVSKVEETSRYGLAFRSVLPGDLDKVTTFVARLLSNRAAR